MNIIGLSGKKQSGKNQVARFITKIYKNKIILETAFADELKLEVADACNTTVDEIQLHKDTYRNLLQLWGTNYRRKFYGEDYWIKKLLFKISNSVADITIITDVRFLNEAQMVKQIGGYLVRIERPSDSVLIDRHPSEIELDDYKKFDFIIKNDGTLDDLYVQTRKMLATIAKI